MTARAVLASIFARSATPAAAETARVSVPNGDLDLTSRAGAATLDGRVQSAVDRICGHPMASGVIRNAAQQRCIREATASARAEIARLTGKGPTVALSP